MTATDIHIQGGLPPMFRVRGKLVSHKSSIVVQREVGRDTLSFASALRAIVTQ